MNTALPGQLDLFADSREVMLRNDLFDALAARDADLAQRAMAALDAESPNDPALTDALCLVAELGAESVAEGAVGKTPVFADAAAAALALSAIEGQLAPAASRLFGATAGDIWLRPCRRELARRAAPLAFDPAQPATHAAGLWLRAADWAAAAAAVEGIASWRRIPAPLAWMARARWHLLGADACWPLMAELAWLAPQRLPELLQALPDARLHRLMRRFEADFAADIELRARPATWAWLPAWALADEPKLAQPMDGAVPSAEGPAQQGYSAMQSLLRLERQGRHHEIVAARQRLRELSRELFATYMRGR